MFKSIRSSFFTGLLILLPLAATIFVVKFLIESIGAPTSKLIFWFIDSSLRDQIWFEGMLSIASIIIIVVFIAILGLLSKYFLGRLMMQLAEKVITSVPFVKTVYNTVKQIVDTFSQQQKAVFQKTVLIEYPRPGVYALGFLTSTTKGEVQQKTGKVVVNVFVPTTPNPTSGFLLMLPEDEVIDLEMSVSDGMKVVISGGALVPAYNAKPLDIGS
ncbi:MAG: hypothetical protein COZ46_03055 [Verrucomicrobia bacterium CG_4_10_14_3_um_filter_43_23]|nr:MAG: hypothetical protein AUJ82_00480 [Verrucomicrobia bacterium CG1_02_43_26]PIP59250.1 MAG: hypothetical protein COX01_04455 [Verrucomicrobia bacterium CG22_combo_CG10-13_8_21_14_all_43_17]PIX58566.1 MAG: hypothetical protein COZ46_03055 [Verrucomicrobia bacterium CG_4_10_14_3_um_filter_43_23]PIY61018.1 MAG: hypothetical protein COY94_07375 [Verrucomicrobia bacterium CG_4_10_14_0_8_um_filter_43_34]PJA43859.1 MAG: hypothetical protein CO175_05745 [Verrucomicrobia bacterium CG_4_9_14_3_um_fi